MPDFSSIADTNLVSLAQDLHNYGCVLQRIEFRIEKDELRRMLFIHRWGKPGSDVFGIVCRYYPKAVPISLNSTVAQISIH